MRECTKCNTIMKEDYAIRPMLHNSHVVIEIEAKLFFPKYCEISVAVCPNCGEVSTYLNKEQLKNFNEYTQNNNL